MKTISTLGVLLLAGNVAAQTDRPATTQPDRINKPATMSKQAPEYAFLDDLLGAKVTMAPGAEARREAAEDNETAKRPAGELADLLIDHRTGNAEVAIVSVGGFLGIGEKDVALPVRSLRWNGEKKQFDLTATEDQLKALPAFNLDQASKRGLDQEIVVVRGNWTKAGFPAVDVDMKPGADDATMRKVGVEVRDPKVQRDVEADIKDTKAVKNSAFTPSPAHYCSASKMDDPAVYAQTEKFGKITKCIVDRANWNIAYCVVSHGGALGVGDTEYLVPTCALTAGRKGNDDVLWLDRSVDQLKTSAVKYEKPKNGVVDAGAAEKAKSAYGETKGDAMKR